MQTDIQIVGGGLSGLALADQISRAGSDFLLFEARDRLGGRILSRDLSGGQFDLGPAWFWPGQPRMAGLARRLSLPVFEQFATGDMVFQNQDGSTRRTRGYGSMQGSLRLDGGIQALIDALAGEIEPGRIHLGASVLGLTAVEGGVSVDLSDGRTVHAKGVALAVPPRVVAQTIKWQPALEPGQLEALAAIPTWMAGQAKIVATYAQPHWRNAGLSGDGMSHRGPLVEIHDASPLEGGPYAVFGFVGVPPDLRAAHREQLLSLACAQLAAMFGPEMAEPLDLVLQDWATVPEIATDGDRVAVTSHPHYGLPANLQDIWGGRVLLASTETAREFGGFLEGALEAADRVAGAVLDFAPL